MPEHLTTNSQLVPGDSIRFMEWLEESTSYRREVTATVAGPAPSGGRDKAFFLTVVTINGPGYCNPGTKIRRTWSEIIAIKADRLQRAQPEAMAQPAIVPPLPPRFLRETA